MKNIFRLVSITNKWRHWSVNRKLTCQQYVLYQIHFKVRRTLHKSSDAILSIRIHEQPIFLSSPSHNTTKFLLEKSPMNHFGKLIFSKVPVSTPRKHDGTNSKSLTRPVFFLQTVYNLWEKFSSKLLSPFGVEKKSCVYNESLRSVGFVIYKQTQLKITENEVLDKTGLFDVTRIFLCAP